MEFSVIICTYNRRDNLAHCLERLAAQNLPEPFDWEVLVVDNNSDDGTQEEVLRLANSLPIRIRYALEREQGLNYARNTGIKESAGRLFSYVDDDILVSERWLASIRETFVTNDADAVGGRIHLDPSIELPAWILANAELKGFLGYQDLGEAPLRLDGRKNYPYGGSMAFNRRVVEKIGYFNPKLGRKGAGKKRSELFKGAETDYFHRLAETTDPRIFYDPRAIVYHSVKPFQLRKRYFRTIHFNAGYQRALYDDRRFPNSLLGIPRFFYTQILAGTLKYLLEVLTSGPNRAFRQQMNVGHMLGTMLGYYKRRDAGGEPTEHIAN